MAGNWMFSAFVSILIFASTIQKIHSTKSERASKIEEKMSPIFPFSDFPSGINNTALRKHLKSEQVALTHVNNGRREIQEGKFLLTACTMIQNEAAYIVEWIEFMRIQGVDRFVIYDDHSSDNIGLLKRFYHEKDPSCEIHVLEALGPATSSITAGLRRQASSFQHCLDTYGPTSEWMVVLDVDEFLYSPAFGTVADLLGNLSSIEAQENRTINHILSTNLNFGSSGQKHRFGYRLITTGTVSAERVRYSNACGIQLLVERHILRGPHLSLEPAMYNNLTDFKSLWICKLPGYFSPCRHNPGKSLFRPAFAVEAGVHAPTTWRSPTIAALTAAMPAGRTILLQGNHYYYKSKEDVEHKAAQWHIPEHLRNFNLTNDLLWNRVRDDGVLRRWGPELARRMRRLVSVEGHCGEEEALSDTGD